MNIPIPNGCEVYHKNAGKLTVLWRNMDGRYTVKDDSGNKWVVDGNHVDVYDDDLDLASLRQRRYALFNE